jgi:hypothetical protein
LESASTIVHLYRSTIASRYNIALQSFHTSDDEDEQSSSSSAKRNRYNTNNKTGNIDSHGSNTGVSYEILSL